MLWVDPPIPIESYLCCLFLLFVFFSLLIFAFNELLKSSQTSKLYVWKNRRKTKPDSLVFVFVFVVDRKWFFSPHSRKRLQEKIVYIFFRRKICIVHRFETSALVNNSTRQHHTNKFFRRRFFFFPPLFSSFVCINSNFQAFGFACLSYSRNSVWKGSVAVSALLNGKFFYSVFGVLYMERARDSTHAIFIRFIFFHFFFFSVCLVRIFIFALLLLHGTCWM